MERNNTNSQNAQNVYKACGDFMVHKHTTGKIIL